MEIKPSNLERELRIRHRIMGGVSAVLFRTEDNLVFKKFVEGTVYNRILERHTDAFLDYLRELNELSNPALVIPDTIYVDNNNCVSGYTYKYQIGTTLREMYPKTELDGLIAALKDFYDYISLLHNFCLDDMHNDNILYTGDIKLIDLDLCYFTEEDKVEENKELLNKTIFRTLFGVNPETKTIKFVPEIEKLFTAYNNQEIDLFTFIAEYRKYITQNIGPCVYLKQLKRGISASKV